MRPQACQSRVLYAGVHCSLASLLQQSLPLLQTLFPTCCLSVGVTLSRTTTYPSSLPVSPMPHPLAPCLPLTMPLLLLPYTSSSLHTPALSDGTARVSSPYSCPASSAVVCVWGCTPSNQKIGRYRSQSSKLGRPPLLLLFRLAQGCCVCIGAGSLGKPVPIAEQVRGGGWVTRQKDTEPNG